MNYIQLSSEHIADLYPLVVYQQPRLMDLPPGAIIGTWVYSVPGKVRYVLDREREIAPGVMPGDLARTWIRDQYKLPIRRRKDQLLHSSLSLPLHARLGKWGNCTYIDMEKAYIQILRLGYDVEYKLSGFIGADPRPVPPEIIGNKLAYAMAVTMSGNARSNLEVMGYEGIYERQPLNIFSNPCLYNLANDTLNGIAAELLAVLGEQCVYVNTDGYIIKEGYEQYAFDIIQSWGFTASIKVKQGIALQGDTEVRGVASYKINGYQTKRFDHAAMDFTGDMMGRDERRWLKTRWSLWAAKLKG